MSGNRYQPVHTGMMTGVKSDYAPVLSSNFKRTCPVCKKRYAAPERWSFTFKDHHYCSYKCYRKALADMAEKDRDKKIRIKKIWIIVHGMMTNTSIRPIHTENWPKGSAFRFLSFGKR